MKYYYYNLPLEKVLENTPLVHVYFYTYQVGVVLHLLRCCSITHWLPLGGAAPT